MEYYTSGRWVVKEGCEEEFVEAWEEFARWSAENFEGASWARLGQQRDNPQHFLSLGSWLDDAEIEAWRAHPEFGRHMTRMEAMLADAEVATFNLRASAGTD